MEGGKWAEAIIARAMEDHFDAKIKFEAYRINRNLVDGIVRTARQGTVGVGGSVRDFAIGIQNNFADPKDLEKVHQDVAAAMRTSVRKSFSASVKTRSGYYRIGGGGAGKTAGGFLQRYSGGALKRAISKDTLAVGDKDGIKFVDEGRLTKEAAHWARLNFGAKGLSIPGRKKQKFRLLFGERVVGTLGFERDARPPFMIPPGIWRDGNKRVAANRGHKVGEHKFFLAKSTRLGELGSASVYNRETKRFEAGRAEIKTGLNKKRTRGIKGNEFLDAGLATMAAELPQRYQALLDGWYRDAKRSVKFPSRITVNPARPEALGIRVKPRRR